MIGAYCNLAHVPVDDFGRPVWAAHAERFAHIPLAARPIGLIHGLTNDHRRYRLQPADHYQGLGAAHRAHTPGTRWILYGGAPFTADRGMWEGALAAIREELSDNGEPTYCLNACGDEPMSGPGAPNIPFEFAMAATEYGVRTPCEQYPMLPYEHWARRGAIANSWNVPPAQPGRIARLVDMTFGRRRDRLPPARYTPRQVRAAGGWCGNIVRWPKAPLEERAPIDPEWCLRWIAREWVQRPWVNVFTPVLSYSQPQLDRLIGISMGRLP